MSGYSGGRGYQPGLGSSGGGGAGATSVILSSADGSLTQVSPSTYNSLTQALTVYYEVAHAPLVGTTASVTNTNYNIALLVNDTTGNQAVLVDGAAGLIYNPQTQQLSTANLSGYIGLHGLALDPTNAANNVALNTIFGNLETQIVALQQGYTNFGAVAAFTPTSAGIASTLIPATSADTDGVTMTSGQWIFAYTGFGSNAIAATACGVYVFNGYGIAITRVLPMSTWSEVVGSRVSVDNGGTLWGQTQWLNTNQEGGTLGVTSITYQEGFSNYLIGTIDGNGASANGASISGMNIYMQSASASNPGLINTGAQTIAGVKTFSSGIIGNITTATNIAAGTIGQIPVQTGAGGTGFIASGSATTMALFSGGTGVAGAYRAIANADLPTTSQGSNGTFTPTASNLTQAGGSASFIGNYVISGGMLFGTIEIDLGTATSTSSIAGFTTFHGMPINATIPDNCTACDDNIVSHGVGYVFPNPIAIYSPTWTNVTAGKIILSFKYKIV